MQNNRNRQAEIDLQNKDVTSGELSTNSVKAVAISGRLFSITKSGLCVSVLLNILDIPITTQRVRKLRYALPVKTKYEMIDD